MGDISALRNYILKQVFTELLESVLEVYVYFVYWNYHQVVKTLTQSNGHFTNEEKDNAIMV